MDEPITIIRWRILRNIHEGRRPYDGFAGSQRGGAICSVHQWRDWWRYISYDLEDDHLTLTDAGKQALSDNDRRPTT